MSAERIRADIQRLTAEIAMHKTAIRRHRDSLHEAVASRKRAFIALLEQQQQPASGEEGVLHGRTDRS
jgi:hypothetical protein